MKYNSIVKFKSGEKIQFPDFTLEFTGIKEVKTDKWTFLIHQFEITHGGAKTVTEWSSGLGEIAPTRFEFEGKQFNLYLRLNETIWLKKKCLADDELIITRQ